MNTTYKLNPVHWKLSGGRITRHFNNGDLICNVGVYDLFTGMDEGKFVGNLFIGTNWNPYKEAIIAIFMAEEMKFLERCISAVGERFSYSAYMKRKNSQFQLIMSFAIIKYLKTVLK